MSNQNRNFILKINPLLNVKPSVSLTAKQILSRYQQPPSHKARPLLNQSIVPLPSPEGLASTERQHRSQTPSYLRRSKQNMSGKSTGYHLPASNSRGNRHSFVAAKVGSSLLTSPHHNCLPKAARRNIQNSIRHCWSVFIVTVLRAEVLKTSGMSGRCLSVRWDIRDIRNL